MPKKLALLYVHTFLSENTWAHNQEIQDRPFCFVLPAKSNDKQKELVCNI